MYVCRYVWLFYTCVEGGRRLGEWKEIGRVEGDWESRRRLGGWWIERWIGCRIDVFSSYRTRIG
jgi:hypothetical protein